MEVIAFLSQTDCIIQDQHRVAIIGDRHYVFNLGDCVYLEQPWDTERTCCGPVEISISFAGDRTQRHRDQVNVKFIGTHAQLRQYLAAATVH